MKCKQKTCKRNPNTANGFCNVCDEVSKEAINNEKKKNESCKKLLKKVEIDHKEMVKMHEKVRKGEAVDSASMNSLLLGGIINILIQHDAIEDLNGKIRTLEEENVGNRARIESLESWASKQAEGFKDITKKMIENKEIDALNDKVTALELEVFDLKSHTNSEIVPTNNTEEMIHRRPCHLCNKLFTKNSDLEIQ